MVEEPPAFLVTELANYGLNEVEARAFLVLTTHGLLKASEVAELVDVPRSSIYPVLKGLMDRGLVESTVERPMRFIAIPVQDAVDKLLHEQRQRLKELETRRTILDSIPAPSKPAQDGPTVQAFRGLSEVPDAVRRVFRDSDTVIVMGPAASPVVQHALEANRQGRVRLVTDDGEGTPDGPVGERVEHLSSELAAEVTMLVGDHAVLLLVEAKDPLLVLIEGPELADGLEHLIDALVGVVKA